MQFHRVVDAIALPVPLDPLAAALFAALFVVCALLTSRRTTYGLAALVLADPFAFSHEVGGTTVTVSKVVLLGVLVGLCTYAGNAARLRAYPAAPIIAAFGLLVVATAISIAGAEHAAPALRETIKAVEYLAFFAAAYACFRIDDDAGPILGAVAVTVIAVSLSALVQEAIGAPSALCVGATVVPRIAGVLEGPNQLAGYFEIAIAILGAWSLQRRSVLASAALALAVCADVLTFSRAGFAGAGIVLVVLIVFLGRRAVRGLWPAWGGLLAGFAGAATWGTYAHSASVLRLSFDDSWCAGGVGSRAELWPAAWRMWLAHPLFGVGGGNFELELPQYGVFGVRTHANSWYLQSLAEGGLALFAAVLVLLATIFVALGRAIRDSSPWVLAAVAATCALALHQIVDYLFFYPKVGAAWCVLLGIAAGAIAASRARA